MAQILTPAGASEIHFQGYDSGGCVMSRVAGVHGACSFFLTFR